MKSTIIPGQVFGRWTVQGKDDNSTIRNPAWLCVCECGTRKSVQSSSLRTGLSTSCGCYQRQLSFAPNLVGQRFFRLLVIAQAENDKSNNSRWLCRCNCGTEKVILALMLKNGTAKSCGCLRRETSRDRAKQNSTHGMHGTPEYHAWENIVQRCGNPKCKVWKYYGGRGIQNKFTSFEEFYAECGPRPDPALVIDRIDNEGHYEPGNIRWTDRQTSTMNSRGPQMITFQNETLCQTDWAKRLGIAPHLLVWRLEHWSLERSLTEPANTGPVNKTMLTFQGVTLSQTDWAKRLGISQSGLSLRLKRLPLEQALTLEKHKHTQ